MDNHPPNNDGKMQESVQDYLDLLLAQATEKPEAQISLLPEYDERPLSRSASVTPLSMVGGGGRQAMPMAEPRSKRTERRGLPVRPFAEPVKPLPLKISSRPTAIEEPAEKKPTKPTTLETKSQVELKVEPKKPAPVTEGDLTATKTADIRRVDSTPDPVDPVATDEQVIHSEAEAVSPELYQTTQWLNGRPSWAQQRFECLLFTVGGLTLAVPLVELGAIHPINDEITPIFGQIDWFMGLLTVKNGTIKTVNTPKLVMPERYSELMKEQFNYVISINGVDWGLAVDKVSTAIVLEPEEVRWRTVRGKRPWLAGTVTEHMCALLDVSQLAALFIIADSR